MIVRFAKLQERRLFVPVAFRMPLLTKRVRAERRCSFSKRRKWSAVCMVEREPNQGESKPHARSRLFGRLVEQWNGSVAKGADSIRETQSSFS